LRRFVRFCEVFGTHSSCPTWFVDGDALMGQSGFSQVESYWAGLDTGYFLTGFGQIKTPFGVNQKVNAVSSAVKASALVCFN
jgi:hypothetical protein